MNIKTKDMETLKNWMEMDQIINHYVNLLSDETTEFLKEKAIKIEGPVKYDSDGHLDTTQIMALGNTFSNLFVDALKSLN